MPATTNPARVAYDQASVEKRLGSRITRKQREAVLSVERPDVPKKALMAYAISGDADSLDEKQRAALRTAVDAAKASELLTSDSQRRRLWPRKVAAILAF